MTSMPTPTSIAGWQFYQLVSLRSLPGNPRDWQWFNSSWGRCDDSITVLSPHNALGGGSGPLRSVQTFAQKRGHLIYLANQYRGVHHHDGNFRVQLAGGDNSWSKRRSMVINASGSSVYHKLGHSLSHIEWLCHSNERFNMYLLGNQVYRIECVAQQAATESFERISK